MKTKLIYILFVLLFNACSCIGGYETPKKILIIGKIQSKRDYCLYISNNTTYNTKNNILGNWHSAIADSCGKWNIGDTIKFY
jgi:hypothetical protein